MKPKPGHKVCSMCGQELPLDMFPTNSGMEDGHLGKCFACWYAFTSDRFRVQRLRERKDKEPDTTEMGVEVKQPTASAEEAKRMAKRMYARAYYRANRETVMGYQRRYFATEKGRAAVQRAQRKRKEWKKTDPERWEELLAKQRAYFAGLSAERRAERNAKQRAYFAGLSAERRAERNAKLRAYFAGLSAERRAERNAKQRAYYQANKERWAKYREKKRQKSLQEPK